MKYIVSFLSLICFSAFIWGQKTQIFNYTGTVQQYVVPDGVNSITVEAIGAGGGFGSWEKARYPEKYAPGKGAIVTATYPVKSGEIIYVYVGGKGDNATDLVEGKGGFNGGGNGNNTGEYGPYCGGGGGGASDIRIGGQDLSNRVIVAGGAGGAGSNYPDGGDHGGNAGFEKGFNGLSQNLPEDVSCGYGGTRTKGGLGGQWPSYKKAEDGRLGFGGNSPDSTSGGGGGGGYYGGGAGCWSGGGGGSSFVGPLGTDIKSENGANDGNGKISITPACEALDIKLTGEKTICHGEEITLKGISKYGGELTWEKNIKNGIPFKPDVGQNTFVVRSTSTKECPTSIDIYVKPGKPVILASKLDVCEGEEVTLEVEDMTGVVWDNGIQQGVAFVPPLGENSYKVTRTGDCAGVDEVKITAHKISIDGKVGQIKGNEKGQITITPKGGLAPYNYQWKDGNIEISIEKDVNQLAAGTYQVIVTDNIGCTAKATYTIDVVEEVIIDEPVGPQIEAEISQDQAFVTVSYPGAFEYKIENENGETVVTGHSVDEDLVEITRLAPGTYRVSLIYKQIKQYTTFVKN